MIKVYAGGTLMVLGLIALIGMPTAGVAMIGAGYWLFQQSTAAQRHGAQSLATVRQLITGAPRRSAAQSLARARSPASISPAGQP